MTHALMAATTAATRPGRQNQGIGSVRLERHHARFDRAGIPSWPMRRAPMP